jgi:hypothetical protein
MTEVKRLCILLLAGVVSIAGCSIGSTGSGPNDSPRPSTTPEPTLLASGRDARIDGATLSADSRVLTLSFVGGPEYVASDHCTSAYVGRAEESDGVLEAEVMDVTPPRSSSNGTICTLEGYLRSVTVSLAVPFLGSRLHDRAGYVLFLRRPSGLIELKGLPSGWLLRSERTVVESPTGRWQRIYSPDATPGGYPEIRELDLFQSFDGPVSVSGGDGVGKPVQIGDLTGMLFGPDGYGEMVLAWQVDLDGLAFVANTADFTPEALIALARTAARE